VLNSHDSKKNIRADSTFENIQTEIRILYFLLFYNFVENKVISKSYLNTLQFSKQLKLQSITKKQVSKFFHKVRIKIKNKMHKIWKENKLGLEPSESGKPSCEIDESKIANHKNETRWMLGIYDRGTKEVRIFYVDNNRTKNHYFQL